MVVGNKVDKLEEKEELQNTLVDFSLRNNVKNSLSSAKTGEGVKEFFT